MREKALMTPEEYARRVEALRKFYEGQRTKIYVGDMEVSEEADTRVFFLTALNAHAPQVQESLRADVLPAFTEALQDVDVLSLRWQDLTGDRFGPLRNALLAWASKWGLEPARWASEPAWMLDAALRLLFKWHEGVMNTHEFTPVYDIFALLDAAPQETQELRRFGGFALLVFTHVLELRPWLQKSSADDVDPVTESLAGERRTQDIAKTVRRAAQSIGLKSVRKARTGPASNER